MPDDADVGAVAEAIVKVVDAPFGKRPFRVHIDPTQDGAEVAFGVIDRVRTEMLRRVRSMSCSPRLRHSPRKAQISTRRQPSAAASTLSWRVSIFAALGRREESGAPA